AGQTATIAVKAQASAVGLHGNTATVSSPVTDPDPSNNTSSSTVEVTPLADLKIVKTASRTKILEGDNYSYTLRVRNDGPSTAAAVTVTDSLPRGVALRSVRT